MGYLTDRDALKARNYHGLQRGRLKDVQKCIQPSVEVIIKNLIKDTTPDTHQIAASLWDRRAIQALIVQHIGKTIPLQRVSVYTKRWGFTPQRPTRSATEQDATKVQIWHKTTYPQIHARALSEGAEIHWGDETGIALSTFYARAYAPRGKTPTIKLPAKRAHISMISSITNTGAMQFMLYEGGLNVDLFMTFIQRLIKHRNRKIFLIVDNLKVHHAHLVTKWVSEHKDMIEIFFPPPVCSPVQPR
jgi:hypothetical protein